MDLYDDCLTLLTNPGSFSSGEKAFIGIEVAIVVYLLIVIIIFVFFPDTYGLNDSGKWMMRVALGAIVVVVLMAKLGKKIKSDIAAKRASLNV